MGRGAHCLRGEQEHVRGRLRVRHVLRTEDVARETGIEARQMPLEAQTLVAAARSDAGRDRDVVEGIDHVVKSNSARKTSS